MIGGTMQDYDKSSKWLILHHGDSILRLAGVDDIETWKPLQAELIQPRRLPDGLTETCGIMTGGCSIFSEDAGQ
jgi:hypothetical protein